MNKSEAIQTLNLYGISRIPCVFIINYDVSDCHVWKINEIPENIYLHFPSFNNHSSNSNKKIQYTKEPISFSTYKKQFDIVQKHLKLGNTFLVNLTVENKIHISENLKEIFENSKAPYKLYYKDSFVVFSPEPFISITNNTIQTFPMKGTIDASIANAEKIILENQKEIAEHATIVDLLRNDLSIVAENVHVKKYRYIDTITSNSNKLLQVSSLIEGTLRNDLKNKLGTIIFSMLPAGSISGAPKMKTVDIINKTESHSRGFYTGIMGYFDGSNLESAVMIRYIEKRGNSLYYKSGGGITAQSNIYDEYNELIQKIYVPTH